jgi:transcriptional regulator with XRE-family HTH domain
MSGMGRRTNRQLALSRAIARHRCKEGLTQAQLGERLGRYRHQPVPQTTISRWELGEVDLTLEDIFDIEEALALPHGILKEQAGYALHRAMSEA